MEEGRSWNVLDGKMDAGTMFAHVKSLSQKLSVKRTVADILRLLPAGWADIKNEVEPEVSPRIKAPRRG